MEKLSTDPYKGVRDFYPEDLYIRKYIFDMMRRTCESFGYDEYDASVLEPAELYRGKNAENEEIVNEQTYTFEDRGGRDVTLRPEMTPTVARMVAKKRRELGFPLRWYSIPNVFRYERPQRGRLREHWQLNADIFGVEGIDAEIEVISLAYHIMHAFGATERDFEIRINSRRALNALRDRLGLGETSNARTRTLFRLLDTRRKMTEEAFAAGLADIGLAPDQISTDEMPEDVSEVIEVLQTLGITNAAYDPAIVRGFDYYTGVVFEVFDASSENTRSMFGGGRYDNLLDIFGEHAPAVGFGMGDVTIRDFLKTHDLLPQYASKTILYICILDEESKEYARKLAGTLRSDGINVAVDFSLRKIGDQIKNATKKSIPYSICIGERERHSDTVTLKNLKTGTEEARCIAELSSLLKQTP